jgi:hypothetical protein
MISLAHRLLEDGNNEEQDERDITAGQTFERVGGIEQ